MTTPNTNCLAGMQCPNCQSFEPFRISVTTLCLLYDEGTETAGDIDWDDNSSCQCTDCGHSRTVADFKTPQ